MRAAAVIAGTALLLSGCSQRFGDAGEWPVLGEEVDRRGLQIVDLPPSEDPSPYTWSFVDGADGATWLALRLPDDGEVERLRLVRLADPPRDEILRAPRVDDHRGWFHVGHRAIYQGRGGDELAVIRPGGSGETRIGLPADRRAYFDSASDNDEAFAWHALGAQWLFRTDGSFVRVILDDTASLYPSDLQLSADGEWAFAVRGHQYGLWHTRSFRTVTDTSHTGLLSVGYVAADARYLTDAKALLVCSLHGATLVPTDGSAPRRIAGRCQGFPGLFDVASPVFARDERACDWAPFLFDFYSPDAYQLLRDLIICRRSAPAVDEPGRATFTTQQSDSAPFAGRLLTVPLDGNAAPVERALEGPLADLSRDHRATFDFSRDHFLSAAAFSIDGVPTVERGRAVRFSRDQQRLYFLEHTANLYDVGDLRVGPIGGPYEIAVRNVTTYRELADGRLIAADDASFSGAHNRVVLVDPLRREVRRLVDGAVFFNVIPGDREVLVTLFQVDGARGRQLLRVPIPPRE